MKWSLIAYILIGMSVLKMTTSTKIDDVPSPYLNEDSGDLLEYLNNIYSSMINSYREPSLRELEAFSELFDILSCGQIEDQVVRMIKLAEMVGYQIVKYKNTVDNQLYYLIQEQNQYPDQSYQGGGYYIINPSPNTYDIAYEAPHPFFDTGTSYQAIRTYFNTNAKYLSIAGAYRYTSKVNSVCSGDYKVSDMAHNDNTLFYRSHVAISNNHPDIVFVQFHGFSNKSLNALQKQCGSTNKALINLSEGINSSSYEPSSFIAYLNDIVNYDRNITSCLYGIDTQRLGALTSVVGRFENGSDDVCLLNAKISSHRFVHIEQSQAVRYDLVDLMGSYINKAIKLYFGS
eukprot:TRINITY_DN5854_c0_g1_i1.p1 TRINITY_DN5854_c0_g1~~TRINITY_DN5854_c0_g1_i1.p1  ORF type:complete len:354 (-),score=27.96 TRINITY_DN5854_c0_g1_i1:360-1394(-)